VPLIDPLPEDHDPELFDLIQFFRGPLGVVPNSILTMQRRPKIARAFTELNKAVMENLGRVTAEHAQDLVCLSPPVNFASGEGFSPGSMRPPFCIVSIVIL
jgi:hypothetical protein